MREEIERRFSELRRFQPAAIVMAIGIALLFLSGGQKEESLPTMKEDTFDRLAVQTEMEEVLQKIEGVGKLRLMLMVDSGMQRELAQDCAGSVSEKEREEKRETIVIGAGGGEQEVVVTRSVYPRFTGALVVCEGADNAQVRYAVTMAVSVLTNLTSNQISVVKGSS